MAEKLSLRQMLFTRNIGLLIQYAATKDYGLTFGEAYRAQWVQQTYWDEGKTRTKASKHTQRLAVDFNLFVDGAYITGGSPAYESLGRYWESLDARNVWGGDWPTLRDYNHFEMQ